MYNFLKVLPIFFFSTLLSADTSLVTTQQPSALRNNYTGSVGFKFTTTQAFTVTSLGRFCITGNSQAHLVQLINSSNNSVQATTNVLTSNCTNSYTYSPITPLLLQPNTSYYLVSSEVNNGDQFYDTELVTLTNVATNNGPVYWNGSNWFFTGATGYSYVPLSLTYTIGQPQPPTQHVLITGQSLSIGTNGYTALTKTQPFQNTMLTNDNSTLIPLVEGTLNRYGDVETIGSSMANTLTNLTTATKSIEVTHNGENGYTYQQLKKGTTPYQNGLNQITSSKNLITNYSVKAVVAIHGEANVTDTISTYEFYLNEWQNNYQTDIQSILNTTQSIPLVIDQMNSWTVLGQATPTVALSQLQASEDYTNIFLVGPKYQYHYTDGLHLDNYSYRLEGEQIGKVLSKLPNWKPLTPKSITRTNQIITVVFNVPTPPLQFDTISVLPTTNYGFEYTDNATNTSIQSLAISSSDTITITLNQIPQTGNERLRYAYTGIPQSYAGKDQIGSAKGNVKDSDNTPSLYNNSLNNWLVTFDKPIMNLTTQPFITSLPTNTTITINNYQGNISYSFTPTKSLTITALGRISINNSTQTHLIKLLNSAQQVIASVNLNLLNTPNNTYQYQLLPTPVQLSPNQTYTITSQEFLNGDYFYDFSPINTNTTDFLINPQINLTFPNSSVYGPVNFLYR